MQVPDIQYVPFPEHSALVPHMHVPDASHLSDVSLEQAGLEPHTHFPETQAFDNSVQSAMLVHSKILMIK